MNAWQIEEYKKCALNFEYFTEKYVKILNTEDGLVNFRLYPYQKRVVEDFEKYKFNIVSKFRQAGLTTVASVYGLWKCMFDTDQRILVVSKTDREAVAVGKSIRDIIEYLPDWLKPGMDLNNDHEKKFNATNSVMWYYTPVASRSRAVSVLLLDEAAFIDNMHEHWAAMYPTLSNGGRCIVISTVNGVGNWYEEEYHKAKEGKNKFHVIEIDFKEHPKYSKPEWEIETRQNLGEKRFCQEILRQFQGSGDTYVSGTVLARIGKGCISPERKMFPEWDNFTVKAKDESELVNENYVKGAMWEWEKPIAGQQYLISADTGNAMGGEGDSSVFHVLNLNNYEQVAEFKSNTIPTFEFAKLLSEVGAFYNEALVVVEDNGQGASVLQRLVNNIQYPNIYYSTIGKGRDKPGVFVNPKFRPMALETMRTCLSQNLIKIRSTRTHSELETFIVRSNNKPQATSGRHDDLVMALAIGLQVSDIMSRRQMPLMIIEENEIKDHMSEAAVSGLDDIRKSIRMGLKEEDLGLDEEFDMSSLLPESMQQHMGIKQPRPNESVLKLFGW